MNNETKWYLGKTKGTIPEAVFLTDFGWECGWYWGGGYIGNSNFHAHFDGAFMEVPDIRGHCLGNFITPWTKLPDYLKPKDCTVISNGCSVWEDLGTFLDDAQYSAKEWWRIKDLFKQFYIIRAAAEVFQYGGHCTTDKRNPAELNKEMVDSLNKHIETVIIPEIRKAMNHSA